MDSQSPKNDPKSYVVMLLVAIATAGIIGWLYCRNLDNYSSLVWRTPQGFKNLGGTGMDNSYGDSSTNRSLDISFRQVATQPAPATELARRAKLKLETNFPGLVVKTRSLTLDGHNWVELHYVSNFTGQKTRSVHALYSSFLDQQFEVIWSSATQDNKANKLYHDFKASLCFAEWHHTYIR